MLILLAIAYTQHNATGAAEDICAKLLLHWITRFTLSQQVLDIVIWFLMPYNYNCLVTQL